jgi:hypothetical protein
MCYLRGAVRIQKPDFTPDNLKNACGVKTVFVPLQCEMIEVAVQKVPFCTPKAYLLARKSIAFETQNAKPKNEC